MTGRSLSPTPITKKNEQTLQASGNALKRNDESLFKRTFIVFGSWEAMSVNVCSKKQEI